MIRKIKFIVLIPIALLISCSDYLDVVPDKTQEISLMFERKEAAHRALATCYHYLPQLDGVWSSYSFASDELISNTSHSIPGQDIMRGMQNVSNPLLGYWDDVAVTGKGSQESLYKAIRVCNTFIENIDLVNDMTDDEKLQWKSEAIFLKAFYHFLLFSQYGPIPIIDVNLPISATVSEVRVTRAPVDDLIDYIVRTIDLSMEHLPLRITSENDLGRIDKVIAASIKSRVLLYAASPLFNGSAAFYENFTDKQGKKLINTTYNKEKWKLAADAAKEAIDLALSSGVKMYTFQGTVPTFDETNILTAEVKVLYDYRYMFVDKWNSELIWGNSSPVLRDASWWSIQSASLVKKDNLVASGASWQWASPTLDVVEAYYTKNGLPMNEDKTYDYAGRYSLTAVTDADKFHAIKGESVPKLHLSREPRFYASIAFDRSIYRGWGEIFNLFMRKGEVHGRKGNTQDYPVTGYLLKKVCHPSSNGSSYSQLVAYPWPIIRLGELYLNYAEALNEYAGPDQKVYDALNVIRQRAGIPDVEVVWADANLAVNVNKHLEKTGLRDIIQQERRIELAFEGERNYDVRRWMKGENLFKGEVLGWSVDESDRTKYYVLRPVGQRSFISPRDYLHPIKYKEITVNSNLVQNPGW